MNLFKNPHYLACLVLLITLAAILTKFDGTITMQMTYLGVKVQVKPRFYGCPIDPKLPSNQAYLVEEKLT